jgi:hypothetical protein
MTFSALGCKRLLPCLEKSVGNINKKRRHPSNKIQRATPSTGGENGCNGLGETIASPPNCSLPSRILLGIYGDSPSFTFNILGNRIDKTVVAIIQQVELNS